MKQRPMHAGLAIAGAMALAASASAQNALGDGRALDANPRVGSGGRNIQRPDFNQELALRNAIVTGNVGGGRHFRGNVGYTAENDFRGVTAEDSLFPFLRDSVYSGLATQNLRGLGGLQMQLESTVSGQSTAVGGDLIVRRAGGGAVGGEFTGMNADASAPAIDPWGNMRGTLRSTGEFLVDNARAPRVLGTQRLPNASTQFLTATPLQGIKGLSGNNSLINGSSERDEFGLSVPLPGLEPRGIAGPQGGTRWDARPESRESGRINRPDSQPIQARVPHDALMEDLAIRAQRVDSAYRPMAETARRDDRAAGAEEIARGEGTGRGETGVRVAGPQTKPGEPGFQEPLPPMAERIPMPPSAQPDTKGEPDMEQVKKDFISRMERLRERLSGGDALLDDDATRKEKEGEIEHPGGPKSDPGSRVVLDPLKPPPSSIDDALLNEAQMLLGHGPAQVDRLTGAEGVTDLYSLHMLKGQQLLEEARWFDAEERFAAALRLRPGDSMAAAGRINAQIGAGMLLSAAVNLRNLLRSYPELIAARFDKKLLPSGERLERIRAHLRQRTSRDTSVARDAALVWAYIGWQAGNKDEVREAFSILDRVDKAMGASPDDLVRVMRAVWTAPETSTPTPTPAAAPPEPAGNQAPK